MLYIVSTPIGNLKDITLRALETLKSADLIAAEDTRHSRKLLSHYDIHTPLTSYFEHNKFSKGPYLVKLLKSGKNIALITDSGTPGISDPGYKIIQLAREADIEITAVPGASALINALVLSGAPADKFIFEGYLPVKSAARQRRLGESANEKRTVIFYESPHRLLKSLKDILQVLPQRDIIVARELTKKFEEIKQGSPQELLAYFEQRKVRGEFVILIKGF